MTSVSVFEKKKFTLVQSFQSKRAALLSVVNATMINSANKKALSKAIENKTAWKNFYWTDSAEPP